MVIAVAVTAVIAFSNPINDDAAWFLHLAERVTAGERLYVDWIEVNPPLIVWLGVPVIGLELATGVPRTIWFPALVLLAGLASLVACRRRLADCVGERYQGAATLAVAAALLLIPSWDWGQREHLALLLTAPYFIACAARLRGRVPRPWLVGVAAGVGFALKPFFVLPYALVESWLFLRRTPVWKGTLIAGGVIASYSLAVLLFLPEYGVLLKELAGAYRQFTPRPIAHVVLTPAALAAIAVLPCVLVDGEGRELRQVLAIAIVGWWGAALLQNKGLGYHLLPALASATLLFLVALVGAGSRRGSSRTVMVATAALFVINAAVWLGKSAERRAAWDYIRLVSAAMEGRRVVVLSPHFSDGWPAAAYARTDWRLKMPNLWPLLASPAGPPSAGAQYPAEEFMAARVVEALAGEPLVLVAENDRPDPLRVLGGHQDFREAWRGYVATASIAHLRMFQKRPTAVERPAQ